MASGQLQGKVALVTSDESSFVSGSFHSVDGDASTTRSPDLPAAFARLTSA